jgi:alpha-L-fucosidase
MPASRPIGALSAIVAALNFSNPLHAADADYTGYPYFKETPVQREVRMKWWHEAKFGMFVHWGIYAIPADGEWHMRDKKAPLAQYARLAKEFNPVKFNADGWMALAQDAGMKYLVITAKHHDGFAMFDSKASGYNIVAATPFKRDPLKELAEACPRHGIRFGVYYSGMADWGHPGGGAGGEGHWDKPAQDGDADEYIDKIAAAQVRELMSNYGPVSEIWFDNDGASGMTPARANRIFEQVKLQPGIIINPRLGRGDFNVWEQHVLPLPPEGDLEFCYTVNGAWGYRAKPAKSPEHLIRKLVDVVSKGGNMLLNVGPDAQGQIPADCAESLRAMGRWLKVNSESIYATQAGPFAYVPWGKATRKASALYLHVFEWPKDRILRVPITNDVTKAILLSAPENALTTRSRDGKVLISLPAAAPDPIDTVVKLEIVGEPARLDSLGNGGTATALGSSPGQNKQLGAIPHIDWRLPAGETSGVLELELLKPEAIGAIRLSVGYDFKKYSLEYESDGQWKLLFSGDEIPTDEFVRTFPPVTAQKFRVNILNRRTLHDGGRGGQIWSVELFPPL